MPRLLVMGPKVELLLSPCSADVTGEHAVSGDAVFAVCAVVGAKSRQIRIKYPIASHQDSMVI